MTYLEKGQMRIKIGWKEIRVKIDIILTIVIPKKKKLGIFYHLISSDKNKEYEMNEVVIVIIISFEADHRKYKGKF